MPLVISETLVTVRAIKHGRVSYFAADTDYDAHLLIDALRKAGFAVERL